jgi:hypothetical protein
MTLSTTSLFDYLRAHPVLRVERRVFVSAAFSETRRVLRQIVEELHDVDEAHVRELSMFLQISLLEWLTTPKKFGDGVLQRLSSFGDTARLASVWGAQAAACIQRAQRSLEVLARIENPLRHGFAEAVEEQRRFGHDFRVYCHRSALEIYQSALEGSGLARLNPDQILHSLVDYRDCETFEVLIKVGPLKSRGWGAVPDAILTAPRFGELLVLAWNGSNDDSDFGFDPCSLSAGTKSVGRQDRTQSTRVLTTTTYRGDDVTLLEREEPVVDELNLFRELRKQDGMRPAILVTLSGGNGVLLSPQSSVISFFPLRAVPTLEKGAAREVLVRGSFLVRPMLGAVDLGGTKAEHGSYSDEWKARLAAMAKSDRHALISKLEDAGLRLVHMSAAIDHWLRPATTVIHAPQQVNHFRILIDVLGFGTDSNTKSRKWWQNAWDEISVSRGVAIREGVIEHDLLLSECIDALQMHMDEIRACALDDGSFRFGFPPGSAITGAVAFERVEAVEDGFLVPASELTLLRDPREADQWRV